MWHLVRAGVDGDDASWDRKHTRTRTHTHIEPNAKSRPKVSASSIMHQLPQWKRLLAITAKTANNLNLNS